MRISQLSSHLSFLFVVALVFVSAVRCSEAVEEKAEAPFSFSFSFDRFEPSPSFASQIVLSGDAAAIDSAIRVTRPVNSSYGGIACREPVRFVGTDPGFSTYFVFSVSQRNGGSLAFSLTPSSASLASTDVLRSGTPLSPSLISVKYYITTSEPTSGDRSANYVAIDVGAKPGVESSELSGSDPGVLSSGQKLHSWIDYDGIRKKIEVRVSKLNDPRPADPLLSHPIDLSNALRRETMLAGISSTTRSGNSTIYSWSFDVKHGAPYSMHSDPLDPHSVKSQPIHPRRPHSWGVFAAMVFAAAALGALLMWYATVSRRHIGPVEYQMNPIEIGYERIVLLDDKVY